MKNIPSKINDFNLYDNTPNAISYGYLYTKQFFIKDFMVEQNRMVRVWLPSTYFEDENKTFPVLYMFDGQNMVDHYTTAYGEWDLDTKIHELIKEKKMDGVILVGIDCPHIKNGMYRMQELCPPYYQNLKKDLNKKNVIPTGNVIGDYIVEHIKPEIDKTFRVSKKWEETGIGGSSMGGLCSFYTGLKYHNVFGYILSFSPAFFLFTDESIKEMIEYIQAPLNEIGRIYFFVGGVGFEKKFIKPTLLVRNCLLKKGFDPNKLYYQHTPDLIHHESSWSKEFKHAITFLLKK